MGYSDHFTFEMVCTRKYYGKWAIWLGKDTNKFRTSMVALISLIEIRSVALIAFGMIASYDYLGNTKSQN